MPDRSKVVTAMLNASLQIAFSQEFASDAMRYADQARGQDNHDAANALSDMAVARNAEIKMLRGIMSGLASSLAEMPPDDE